MLTDEVCDVPHFRVDRYPTVRLGVVLVQLIQGDERLVALHLHLRTARAFRSIATLRRKGVKG